MCQTRETDEWRVYAKTDIPEEWVSKEVSSSVTVDHYWDNVLKLKSVVGSQRFCILTKVIKCALSLSHGNSDNERVLSVNKKNLSRERTILSITIVNGFRATEGGIRNMDGLSNISVSKKMLSLVKDSHRAHLEHLDIGQKKQDSQKRKKTISFRQTERKGEENANRGIK